MISFTTLFSYYFNVNFFYREILNTISELIPPKPARRNEKGKIIKQRGKGNDGGYYVSPLAQLLLSHNNTAEVILRILAMGASWPDSTTLGIILKVTERILPFITQVDRNYFSFVGGTLLTSLLRTLFSESAYSKENQHGLIHVISLMYNSISLGIRPVEQGGGGVPHLGQPHSDIALRVFASLPGSNESAVGLLNQNLMNEKSTKQRRLIVQEFLQGCAAASKLNGGSTNVDSVLRQKLAGYLNLPEPVIDLKRATEKNQAAFERASGAAGTGQNVSNMFG